METPGSESGRANRDVRRRILLCLYETYASDPLAVLSPKEVEAGAEVTRDELMGNILYLEERGFIQCMKRYGSRLFAAARITPAGIDLVENPRRLAALFGDSRDRPTTVVVEGELELDVAEMLRRLYLVVYEQDYDTDQRNALLEDLRAVEFEFNRPAGRRRLDKILCLLEWIHEPLAEIEDAAREIDLLRALAQMGEQRDC